MIKDFVFRIETPPFTEVLKRRLQLAMSELAAATKARLHEYSLDSGMKVVYPATELGYYLASIFKSIYDHDRLLRKLIIGLAGRDIRRAMEIFLDFCRSGHIGMMSHRQLEVAMAGWGSFDVSWL